jgi:hypothetical protein
MMAVATVGFEQEVCADSLQELRQSCRLEGVANHPLCLVLAGPASMHQAVQHHEQAGHGDRGSNEFPILHRIG